MLEEEKWMRETRVIGVKEKRIKGQFFGAVRMSQIWAPLLSREILQDRLFSKLPGLIDNSSFVVHFSSNLCPKLVVPLSWFLFQPMSSTFFFWFQESKRLRGAQLLAGIKSQQPPLIFWEIEFSFLNQALKSSGNLEEVRTSELSLPGCLGL